MNNELSDLYNNLVADLNDQKRGQVSLTHTQIAQVGSILLRDPVDNKTMQMSLCLLSHCIHPIEILDDELLILLSTLKNVDLLVMALGTFEHIVLQRKARNADRILPKEISALRDLLLFENLEVVEWSLRLIEGLGAQSIHFKKDLIGWKRPNFIQNPFDPHYKAIKSLILYINNKLEK